MNEQETALLAAIGMEPGRVLTRRPLTIAFGRHFYFPGMFVGLLAFAIACRHGVVPALAAGGIAGLAFTVSMVAHECGHLFLGRRARGITPRLLLMRSTGGVSIVEGRYEDASGAALFAAGGPIATLLVTIAYVVVGLMFPVGPFGTALLLPAALNVLLLGVNLLPLAPMDGYMLFRSALWASLGSRTEAERRAIRWSRYLLFYGLFLSLLVFWRDQQAGIMGLVLLASFAAQHRLAARRIAPAGRAR